MFNWSISVLGDWKDVFIPHVIIFIKSEVFPLLSYFSVVVCLRCLLHHILSLIVYTFRENREFVFIILCNLWWMQIFGYVLACRSYSFVCTVHHPIIIIVQTYLKALSVCQIYFVECVSKKKHILSVIQYTICGAVWFQFTHFSCDDWDKIYTKCLIIIIKSEVWTITHCLGLGHEKMVSAVCLSTFLWVVDDTLPLSGLTNALEF